MKWGILIVFLFAINTATIARDADTCQFELRGIILDADTKDALPYVKVNVKGTQHFFLTDTNGVFHFKELCDQSNALVISCSGYCDTTCQHFFEDNSKPIIYLKKEIRSLEAVNITAINSKKEGFASISQETLDKEAISLNPTQTLASAISQIEGVTFTSSGNNVQLPVIHGLYGNRVLMLNNGIKHGFQNWGTDHAPEIDVLAANNIRVLKGAAGVRYGPEALGGAVIVEADPLSLRKPLEVQIGTGYQTNGRGYFFKSEIAQGLKQWSYHAGANYTRIGDRHAPNYILTNSGKEEKSFNGGFRYHLARLDINVYYSFLDQS